MIYRRNRALKKKAENELLTNKYQEFLSTFLILPIDDSFLGIGKNDEMSVRLDIKDISKSHQRMLLATEIYNFKKDLVGHQEKQLRNYFFGLGLQSEVIKMLNSFNWTQKVVGIQMANSFSISECQPLLQKFINHKNKDLSIEAILGIIKFEGSFEVLKRITRTLNDWECHKIMGVAKEKEMLSGNHLNVLKKMILEIPNLQRLALGVEEIERKEYSLVTF